MRSRKKNTNRETLILAGLGGIFLVIMLYGWVQTNRPVPNTPEIDSQVYSMATLQIAKHFDCSCGACSDDTVADCNCPTAKATRKFIENKVQGGLNEQEIINQVQSTFGYYRG